MQYVLNSIAAMPADYDPPPGLGVTFSAGLLGDAMQCVTIPTTDDEVLEGEHDFMVMLDSATPDVVTIGTSSSHTATLLDNESKIYLFVIELHANCCLDT